MVREKNFDDFPYRNYINSNDPMSIKRNDVDSISSNLTTKYQLMIILIIENTHIIVKVKIIVHILIKI